MMAHTLQAIFGHSLHLSIDYYTTDL